MANKPLEKMKEEKLIELIKDINRKIDDMEDDKESIFKKIKDPDELKKLKDDKKSILKKLEKLKNKIESLLSDSTGKDKKMIGSSPEKTEKQRLIESIELMADVGNNFKKLQDKIGELLSSTSAIPMQRSILDQTSTRGTEVTRELLKAMTHKELVALVKNKLNAIEELLSGATFAEGRTQELLSDVTITALASKYGKAREEYATCCCFNPIGVGFLLSLILFAVSYGDFFLASNASETSWSTIILQATSGLLLILAIWFWQRAIADTKRINEEYHHKQRVMEMYDGLWKHIEQSGDKDAIASLTKMMLNVVAYNPTTKTGKRTHIY